MLQRPHFLPKVSPRSVAQTAHCVRIIFYMVKSLGGSLDAVDAKGAFLASGRKTLAFLAGTAPGSLNMRVAALHVDSERLTSSTNRRASAAPRELAAGSHHHTAPMAAHT